jgi:cytochrome d ubiquinol oxidase subunit I
VYATAWLRGRRDDYTRSAIRVSLAVGAVTALVQPISGDLLAKFVFDTQPAKFAAMEGQFVTQKSAPLRIGGWPDEERGETKWAIEIPGGLSFLATHDFSAEVHGLDRVPREDWPNVELTHGAFQVMVGAGTLLMIVSLWFWIRAWRLRKALLDSRRLLWALVICGPMGFIALEAGWVVTEVGRQPWVINGIMRTADAVTPAEGVQQVFYGFTVLYLLLAGTVIFLLRRLARADKAGEYVAPQEMDTHGEVHA